MESEARLSIRDIHKTFHSKDGLHKVVDGVSLDVKDNEFLVILGPGYCGKSVLMNMIANLMKPDSGEIVIDGNKQKFKDGTSKKVGMVFQKLSLAPWKTVMQNVEFGLKLNGVDKEKRRKVAQKYIDLVGLTDFEKHYPHELSGGMKQRVGIARAYTNNPEILIMDEPFGQLDAQTRYSMQKEIIRIWEKDKRTIVFITNNIEEACYLGDRIVLLTECPAKVKKVYELNMPRPRNMVDKEFLEIRKIISDNTDLSL
ncbi:ABC transporter ATP-binding protein [Vallitalea pronyensis]|uniref:ABC transporter ATP-binding protein n=1 Tax=Vallitalea pronyensis TaxID=1348613 RepID=A0A8J8MN54_9FIRM|nr:ABC transporter ATP-binding protein [Vallitalea pronyensis]QUI24516.1 ABC transporter ATP-binding protein [Vallitalea pronyensis]